MKNFKRENINFILIVVFFYLFLHLLGVTCPIKALTGISCPGCGMTRSWLSLLTGNLDKAFYYHPLFIVPLIILLMYLFKQKFSEKTYKLILYGFLFLFIVVYIIRLKNPEDNIVVCQPKDSLIYRLWLFLKK